MTSVGRLRAVFCLPVPELTRSAGIKLNKRHLLKLLASPLSSIFANRCSSGGDWLHGAVRVRPGVELGPKAKGK
jgi:hypothetical protein